MIEYLAGSVLVVLVLAFVGWPLLRRQSGHAVTSALAPDPARQRASIYRELVELELDHRIGKVSADDFREQADGLLARAAALIVVEDAENHTAEEQIEREISSMREALKATSSSVTRDGAS
ncbi:MAG: hypothetical protein IT306_04380 [Chloroflexi bacterium]|nr:hypothetical protein [Chloroflexota bacterium]